LETKKGKGEEEELDELLKNGLVLQMQQMNNDRTSIYHILAFTGLK